MRDSKENFRKWFVELLAPLKENGEAGFVLMLVAFPLLERYLRNKLRREGNLEKGFFDAVGNLLDIPGRGMDFWDHYRNGLLHRVTFKNGAGISGYDKRAAYFHTSEQRLYVNPPVFFELVTSLILDDFQTYEGSCGQTYALAQPMFDNLMGSQTLVATITVSNP